MAKLSAHGYELFRWSFPGYEAVLMSDGTWLYNYGSGWKVYKNVTKEGQTPHEAAEKIRSAYMSLPAEFHEYVKALKRAVPLAYRARLHALIQMMPSDPDGVWGELTDFGVNVLFEEVKEAVDAYNGWIQVEQSKQTG